MTRTAPILLFSDRSKRRIGLVFAADIEYFDLPAERACGRKQISHLQTRIRRIRIDDHADHGGVRNQFANELEALRFERASQHVNAGGVATRPVEAVDEPDVHRIVAGDEHDRYRRSRGLGSDRRGGCAESGKNGYLPPNQVGCERRQLIELSVRPAIFDLNVLALDVAGLIQALEEPGRRQCERLRREKSKKPYHLHRGLLRARGKRQCDHPSAERGYELPPANADCHLIHPQWDHAGCNTGKNITHQPAGLALAAVAVA